MKQSRCGIFAIVLMVTGCGGDAAKQSNAPSAATPTAEAPPVDPTMGTHGMLVFGLSSTFVSHLPMYGAPHDYQVIAEVKLLKDPAKFNQKLFAQGNSFGYHTIKPEPFALRKMRDVGFRFSATLYAGHFEREGHTELGPVTVEVTRVIHFRQLKKVAEEQPVYRAFTFGNPAGGEYYLAHHIGGAPSFDQISLIGEGAPSTGDAWANGLEVTAMVHDDAPLTRYANIRLRVGDQPVYIRTRAVYTEVGELKE